jgi:hypothetical protein
MSQQQNPGSGGTGQTPGGASDNPNNNQNPASGAPNPQSVSYESYSKLLDEKKKRDEELRALRQRDKEREEADLRQKEDWKKLLEQREIELKDERDKRNVLESRVQTSIKLRAFLGAVPGNVEEQYWPLIDTDQIVLHPETGMPDPATVAKVVKEFEQRYPLVIQKNPNGSLPGDAPRGAQGQLSYEAWLKLPLKDKKARLKEMIPGA